MNELNRNLRLLSLTLMSCGLVSCSSLWKDFDEKMLENKEFDNQVKISEIAPAAPVETPPPADAKAAKKAAPKKEPKKTAGKKPSPVAAPKEVKHEPALEDSVGFVGRRPLVDPFRENEQVSYIVSYFGAEAGRFTVTNKPFVQVNGKKSYHFHYHARSSSVFSMFYAVDDVAETFVDYETLVPHSYSIKARESKQVRDVKNYFNWTTMKAKTWDKKIKKGKGPEERNFEWDLLPYSQNVFSVAQYLRCFQLAVGKEFATRVAHDGKNILMKAKVVREEKLSTAAGSIDTWVVKPQFEIDGVFKPVGDIFLWLSKDDRKVMVRLESKVKIGTIVVAVDKISPPL